MDNLSQNFENEHPPHERFLLYVDGELAPKEAAKWQAHLDACWSCRVRVGKIEETIADIIEFENTVSNFQVSRGGQNWGNFDSRLNALAQEVGKKSFAARIFGFWKQAQNFLSFNWAGKFAASSLAVLLIFAIVYQFVLVSPVSASELLERARAAQSEKLKAANQPVIYQKFKVSEQNKSAVLEVWNEIRTAKNKTIPAVGSNEDSVVLDEYETAMTGNGFDSLKPLSAEVFGSWRERFAEKSETVAPTRLADGADAFKLTTVINEPRAAGEITQASLVVRESDWHPVSQVVSIKTDAGEKTFEVFELEFRVINRDTLAKNFFGEDATLAKENKPNAAASPNASPDEKPSPSQGANVLTNANTEAVSSPNATATADLEVEVLNLLSQAKADLGEQISVVREQGLVKVRGIVETAERKNEILNQLQSVQKNPVVKIEIQTVAEAVAKQKPDGAKDLPTNAQGVEIQSQTIAAEAQLRAYFERQGSDADGAIRTFAARRVAQSRTGMQHLGALKKLANQFSPAELKTLTPEAREKWLALIRSHARAFYEQDAALRGDLKPVFFAGASESAGDSSAIAGDSQLLTGIRQLFELGAGNDQVIRSAFTASSGTRVSAISSPQFWKSLKDAEALARQIQNFR